MHSNYYEEKVEQYLTMQIPSSPENAKLAFQVAQIYATLAIAAAITETINRDS